MPRDGMTPGGCDWGSCTGRRDLLRTDGLGEGMVRVRCRSRRTRCDDDGPSPTPSCDSLRVERWGPRSTDWPARACWVWPRNGARRSGGSLPAECCGCAVRVVRQLEFVGLVVVVTRYVARHLGALEFLGVGGKHGGLDLLPAHGIDGMGDVGVELGPPVGVAECAVLVEPAAALVAETAPQVILRATVVAAIGQLARRHRDEEALGALDDLEVADDEHVVEGDAAKGLQPLVAARVVFHELDADFSDLHSRYSFTWRLLLRGRRSRPGPILVRGIEGSPRRESAAAELRQSPK